MKVKIIDEEHEMDLEDEINDFIEDKEVYDIKYSTSVAISGEVLFILKYNILIRRR